jgi:hypothetical protein
MVRPPLSQISGTFRSAEIRAYLLYLTNDRRLAASSIIVTVSALRFFYTVTPFFLARHVTQAIQQNTGTSRRPAPLLPPDAVCGGDADPNAREEGFLGGGRSPPEIAFLGARRVVACQ